VWVFTSVTRGSSRRISLSTRSAWAWASRSVSCGSTSTSRSRMSRPRSPPAASGRTSWAASSCTSRSCRWAMARTWSKRLSLEGARGSMCTITSAPGRMPRPGSSTPAEPVGQQHSGQPGDDHRGAPYVGAEVQGVGFERLRVVLARHAVEGAGAEMVNGDADGHDPEGPNRRFHVDFFEEQPPHRLPDDPGAGQEQQTGLEEGGEVFDLAVAVLVVGVGGPAGAAGRGRGGGGGGG